MGFTSKFQRPEPLPAGTYSAYLVAVNDAEIVYKDNAPIDALDFVYLITTSLKQVEIHRKVSKTVGERGNLFKDLKGMLGERLTPEVLKDDNRLAAAINYCVGKTFVMSLDINDRGWNKVNSVISLPENMGAKPVRASHGAPQTSPSGQGIAGGAKVVSGLEGLPDKPSQGEVKAAEYDEANPPPMSDNQVAQQVFDDDDIPF